ncbi:hypothetical protein TUM19329_21980 [Legionella antarctica]|uniref:Uncharacterized protein n=1 Tax=Legionella antarctica TaxID=2708020 RepID=A0A6F8T6Q7_9GAMM|nr:hypothetical protein [Legionella antarctica]BCA95837.1 hypothetical protein TUM19329_21980 [Legionella antarctica]
MAYLQEISKINGEFFPAALKGARSLNGNNCSGRLFYEAKVYSSTEEETKNEKSQEQLIQEGMENFFKNEKLIEYSMQRLSGFEPVMDEKCTVFTKDFVEDFFKLIESTKEWQEFYQDRINELGETKAGDLVNSIKGAFAYKVIGAIPQEKRGPGKDKLLNIFFSNYPDMSVPFKEYKQKNIVQLNGLKEMIETKVGQLKALTSNDSEAREKHEQFLSHIVGELEKNIVGILDKPEFKTLERETQNKFLLHDLASILFDIKTVLNGLNQSGNESILKVCQRSLADCVIKIINKYNQNDELGNLDWNNNPKLMVLTNFAMQHKSDFRGAYQKRYEDTFKLFETKINLEKEMRKHKVQSSQSFFQSEEIEKGEEEKEANHKPPGNIG